MRGRDQEQSQLFSYVSLEERVPRRHSLRLMRKFTDEILAELSEQFEAIYSDVGRPSIPPEQLLRALLLQVLYSIRSERLLMEQLDYNLLFRWFVGLELDDRVWVATVFTKNRDRLLKGEIAEAFLQGVVRQARRKRLLSDEHFTVDGTLLEAWASQKSFQPKDGPPSSGADFHREKRSNKTHASRTDPDARLAKKGPGKEAKLSYQASVLMDNRHGFLVATDVAEATGTAERDSALAMLDRLPTRKRRRTLGADKLYDTKDFVRELRERNFTPHVAQNVSNRRSAIDGRTTRHSGYEQSQRRRPMVEQGFGWDKTVGGLRKLRHRGTERVGWVFTFTVAVYDLVRLRTLGSWPECLHERLRGREVPTLGHESAIRTAGKVLPHVGSPSPTAGTHSRYYFFSSLLGRTEDPMPSFAETSVARSVTVPLSALLVCLLAMAGGGSRVEAQETWWPSQWGAGDERGAANRLTPDKVLEAVALITTGHVYALGRTYEPGMPLFGDRHYSLTLPGAPTGGPLGANALVYNDEMFSGEIGQIGTQFDGLGHIGTRRNGEDFYYNGFTGSEMYGPYGLARLGVENVGPIVTRGVLIDVARYRGVARLPAGEVVTRADTPDKVEGALEAQEVALRPGDAVFIRTGHGALWMIDNDAYNAGEPGIGLEGARWLVEQGIVLKGADSTSGEVLPGEDPDRPYDVHRLMIMQHGIHNLENLNLDEIAADEVWEFAFMFSPLPLKGATGSPGNPIAIR